MFSFLKKKKSSELPEWADFFTPEEYATFIEEVEVELKSRNIEFTMIDGKVKLETGDYPNAELGLANVAQVCKQSGSIHDYADIVHGHFSTIFKAFEFDREFDRKIEDFEAVQPYLAVRLYNHDYISHITTVDIDAAIEKYIADDLYAVLVYDLPDTFRTVLPAHVENWGLPEQTVFNIAKTNVRSNYPLEMTREDLGGFHIWYVNNDHYFSSNIIFELEDRPELIGRQGCLIGLPHRHAAIIYPINDLGIVEALPKLIPAVFGMFHEGPGSLTPNLYWYRHGSFMLLPYEERENRLHLIPPEHFLDMIAELEKEVH